jgi:uncharacterized membrane protein HdeD (DUF308 family)
MRGDDAAPKVGPAIHAHQEVRMSTQSSAGPAPGRTERRALEHESEHGQGWLTFAGIMLAVLGILNVVYGIAAIDDANVYVGDTRYVFGDLSLWGWLLVLVGAVQFIAAFSIWNGTSWGRWVGILSAGANAILQLLWMPAFPILALSLLAIDVLVLYALVQYGGRRAAV